MCVLCRLAYHRLLWTFSRIPDMHLSEERWISYKPKRSCSRRWSVAGAFRVIEKHSCRYAFLEVWEMWAWKELDGSRRGATLSECGVSYWEPHCKRDDWDSQTLSKLCRSPGTWKTSWLHLEEVGWRLCEWYSYGAWPAEYIRSDLGAVSCRE